MAGNFPWQGSNFVSGVQPGTPFIHPQFNSSVLHRDNVAPRQSQTSVPAPLELGRLPDFDPRFAEGNADRGGLPGDEAADPAGAWHPMWQEDEIKMGQSAHRHKYQMEGYHSMADMLQHGETFYSYGNQAAPYNLNLEQPTVEARHRVPVYSSLGM